MLILPLLSLISWYSLLASAWFMTNITIDDTKGDYATFAGVDYGDGELWSDAQNCTENGTGLLCPNPNDAFEKTYHASVVADASASVTFVGTSLIVYGILVWNASTELTFTLDGVTLNEGFTHLANDSAAISYDVQMFASGNLSWDTHTFTMTNGIDSLAIFDYMLYSTHASIDAVSSGSASKSKTTVIAVVIVILVLLFALGGVLYYCRRRRYKGYGPPMDRIFFQDGWGEKGLRPQQSNASIRAGLLKPDGVTRTQGTSSTMVGTSSASDNATSAALSKETQPLTVGAGFSVAEPPPPSLPTGAHGGSSPQVRHGHPATLQLTPLMIPERHTQIVAAQGSNTSSSKTPPPLPSKGSLPNSAQGETQPAGTRSTLPAMPNMSPPTSFPSPPSSLGSKKNKRPRPRSDPRSGAAVRQEHIRSLTKRRSAVNGAATPSTGSRTSGMMASDRTTASTPTSMMAPDGFCWNNTSMPDLPARADSVKTVSTMPLTGRHCDRLTGNVYVDTTPLPDNASFPLRSNTDKSSDTMSPGTAWTTNGSSISHTRSFSPPATFPELEPVPVVDRRPVVESPVSLPNSPNVPLIAATLRMIAPPQMARMSASSDSAVPIEPRRMRDEAPLPADLPSQGAEDASAEEATVVVSPTSEVESVVEPSTPALRPSSPSSVSNTAPLEADPPDLAAGPPEAQQAPPSPLVAGTPDSELPPSPFVASTPESPPSPLVASTPEYPPSPLMADSPRLQPLPLAEEHPEPVQRSSPASSDVASVNSSVDIVLEGPEEAHPQPAHPVLSIIVQPDLHEPPPRSTRMEGDRPRKLPPVPLPLSTRLDTVHEDVVSPRFRRPLPRPQTHQEADRSTSMSSTISSRDSVDTAEVTVGERFNVLSAVGHSLQVHSPQPSVPVLLTPNHDLFTQWYSDASDASSVSSRRVALTRENSTSSAGVHAAPNRALDTNIPRLWSKPSLDKLDSSPVSTPAERTPSVRALPLVPNRAPDMVLGTMLQVDRGGSEASSLNLSTPSSTTQSSGIPRSVLLSPNRHPAMPLMGPRALPSITPSERGSVPSLGKGEPPRRRFALLEQEIDYMWNSKTSNVTVLFLVNRYILLVSAVLGILSVFDWTSSWIVIETILGTQAVNTFHTATFTGPISSILVARFMLDLRAVDRAFTSGLSDTLSGSEAYSPDVEAPAI
ncbi:hypothetical protein FOMPIDRAFT_1050374 [Fomitopsis schrenkii]|uniref:DUF6533 domain-containing protein n=1 Tax=Fomitopsis schrenkii TaxID=2126942 RepID=S8FMN3_FOMSC|nr:hypothetical protein FOMPIDRAFT_1050374 [Fomitopsis schrenkii]